MAEHRWTVSRRSILRGAAAAGVVSATGAMGRAGANPGGPRVAVFGGGVAGLTAAHELAERGFQVTVYERRALGGKARSIPVPGTGSGGRPDLPGEHGFRFFPGFYQHIPDTMRRIPFAGNAQGVWNNLIAVPEARFARRGGDDFHLPLGRHVAVATTPEAFLETVGAAVSTTLKLPPAEGLFFANRLLVFNTSSDARRIGQWEHMSWFDYVGGHRRSHEFRALISRALTSIMVAAKEDIASVRTIGTMGEQFLGNPLEVGNDGALDRVLNGPTNAAWIDPWTRRLSELGVRFELGAEVRGLEVRDRRISAARIVSGGTQRTVEADYFVVALSAEQACTLWSPDVLAVRPELAAMDQLFVDWMTGIQFYLREPATISRGHTAYVDAPWSLTSISQNQLWTSKLTGFGDGSAQDCLSVDISDWNTPGVLYGKPAKECTHQEIAREVWAQMKAHVGDALRDDALHSWFLDPAITWHNGRNSNADPLLINTAGSYQHRPETHGDLENLFLAGDYVRTNVDLATMEGANESARAAVNALLDVAGSNSERCRKFTLYRAPELEPLRRMDADRYAAGLPNFFDTRL
ncbi:FAD-dependent oxidoreductase [Nocardia sp. NPDC127579]|uniref:hydroxysqualene dehydroxylase n=1 Tax=Nocardia sp. NPDC127579 TaxID=3345402 RepID=UPI003628E1E9